MNYILVLSIAISLVVVLPIMAEEAGIQFSTDLTVPTFPEQTDIQADYVDMQQINGRFCPDHPFRPGWVMVQPRGYQWKTGLLQDYYYLERTRAVVAAGQCSCDLMFPSWNDMRPELEQFLAQFPNVAASEFTPDQGQQLRDVERGLQQTKRSMASEFRQLCQSVMMGD